jgi:hypothetical protein
MRMATRVDEVIEVKLSAEAWLERSVDLLGFDHRVHEAEDASDGACVHVVMTGDHDVRKIADTQAALRYQRLKPRFNSYSKGAVFEAIRARHRALHPLQLPLARADYEHAVDVWQWVLRLAPAASMALQLAALFHDIERLQSETRVRVEHHADDYGAFKRRHAGIGATIARETLSAFSLTADVIGRVEELVSRHEQPQEDAELALLNDADALSFFCLNSPGFVRYYDDAHSAKKVAYTLARMSPAARAWLPALRLEEKVAVLLQRCQSA